MAIPTSFPVDPGFWDIRVVVLTTSTAHEDVEHCYAAGADAFVSKPVDLVDFAKALQIAGNIQARQESITDTA